MLKTHGLVAFCLVAVLVFYNSCTSNGGMSASGGANNGNSNGFDCQSTPVAKGGREFGMDILDEPTSGGNYSSSLQLLSQIGGSYQTFHIYWNAIEGAGGSGTTSGALVDPNGYLAAMDAAAASTSTKITLRLHPVDLPGKYVPNDLSSTRFNSANMSTRFTQMLAFVFTKINPSRISHLQVGNEIDGYNPGADVNFWYDYPVFLYNVKVWLANNYPSIKIGFVSTIQGVVNNTPLAGGGGLTAGTLFTSWLSSVDLLGVTYYPANSSYQMQANSNVSSTMQALAAYTTKPIHIEEVGYATSSQNAGSEDLQAEFFCEVFKAWDHYPTKFESIAVLRMVDISRANAESSASNYPGMAGNENFIEYLRTLGVRTTDNQSKAAYNLIQSELAKRGF